MNLKDVKINFLGDSITEGNTASSKENNFVNLVASLTGSVTRNYGVGGTRIAKQKSPSDVAQYDMDFISRVEQMDEDADVVFIFGGTNDYGHGDAEMGEFKDASPYTFYGALHTLYKTVIEKFPSSTIVVATPMHRVNEDNPYGEGNKKVVSPILKEYVQAIRDVAEYYSLPVLDLFANSGIQPNVKVIRETYTVDGLHPNDKGYMLLAKRIISFLENL